MHINLTSLELRALDYLVSTSETPTTREDILLKFVRAHLSELDPAKFAPDAPAVAVLTAPMQITPVFPEATPVSLPAGFNAEIHPPVVQAPPAVDDALALEDEFMRAVTGKMPPAVQAVIPMPTPRPGVAVQDGPLDRPAHPCMRLNPTPPRGVSKGDCQGGCDAQPGRPCHWAAGAAHQCAYFTPIRIHQGARSFR